jgi:hypothetical protein
VHVSGGNCIYGAQLQDCVAFSVCSLTSNYNVEYEQIFPLDSLLSSKYAAFFIILVFLLFISQIL